MRALPSAGALLAVRLACPAPAAAQELTAADARSIVQRAASEAARRGGRAVVAVTDPEGAPLAVFRMAGAPASAVVAGQPGRAPACGSEGFEGLALASEQAALSKAATAALVSSGAHAFSTRTAGFLIQHEFPPGVASTPAGPFNGMQFSSLPCGDLTGARSPFGLSPDPGGLPLYKEGRLAGGVAVEGDGVYGFDADVFDLDVSWEESAALAGAAGLEPPAEIRADRVAFEGIRLPYANSALDAGPVVAVDGVDLVGPRSPGPSRFVPAAVAGLGGTTLRGLELRGGAVLAQSDVARVVEQAARQAERTRSALRRPLNSAARVSIAVVDVSGALLALWRAPDAPLFGVDAAVQGARTAAFFSGPQAGAELLRAGMAAFVRELALDGSIAYTSRAIGFAAQPFLPPGVPDTDPGPLGVGPPPEGGPFHTGLQSELLCAEMGAALAGVSVPACTAVPGLAGGMALAGGGVPLYKDGRLAGAVGVGGDGPDQNDLIAAAGATGLEAPAERRCDRVVVRGVRLPWLKFPRHPEL